MRHGEAGAGEEVPHVDGGPADLAGGGAAGGSCRGHAAVQPPAAPGEQVLPVPHGAPWEYPLSSVIVKGGGGFALPEVFCSLFGAAVGGAQEGGVRRASDGGGGREPQQEVSIRAFALPYSLASGRILCSVLVVLPDDDLLALASRSPEIHGRNFGWC